MSIKIMAKMYLTKLFLENNMDILNILNEKTGKKSAMRVAMLGWAAGILILWGWTSFASNELQAIPESVTTLFGILVTGKVVQRYSENTSPKL